MYSMLSRIFMLAVLILFATVQKGMAQPSYWTDSLKRNITLAKSDREKVAAMISLAQYYTGDNNELADEYATQALEVAELSRDRKLMIDAYLKNGNRRLNLSGLADNIQKALDSYAQAEKIAKENGLDAELATVYCAYSRAYQAKEENDKASAYSALAVNIAGNLDNDTIKVMAYASAGDANMVRNDKLPAFRNYLEALNTAVLSKDESLLVTAYANMRDFYFGIEEYDKAIDYSLKCMALDRKHNNRYKILSDYNRTGDLFTAKKQYPLALKMYENSMALADSLHFDLYKINSYLSIFNMYFNNNEYLKGMEYLNTHKELSDFLEQASVKFFFDEAYGYAYAEMGRYDSALYYFKKAEPDIERKGNPAAKYQFYSQFGDYYRKRSDYQPAITYYLKARQIGYAIRNLNYLQNSAKNLDTLYEKSGDFKTAYSYNLEYNMYRDSLKTLSRETDLLKLEVDNDNRQRDRIANEEKENIQHRHNIQYMGLTAGLAGLFVLLIMLGFFVVHPGTIRALGFFSFIFLFEFIILLTDKQIDEWTHGEPWKILMIKISLAAVLLPLHHWLEHKVIHYLSSRKKIAPAGMSIFGRRTAKKSGVASET
jgi:tetratricopeptide (TPR) repeat protein